MCRKSRKIFVFSALFFYTSNFKVDITYFFNIMKSEVLHLKRKEPKEKAVESVENAQRLHTLTHRPIIREKEATG